MSWIKTIDWFLNALALIPKADDAVIAPLLCINIYNTQIKPLSWCHIYMTQLSSLHTFIFIYIVHYYVFMIKFHHNHIAYDHNNEYVKKIYCLLFWSTKQKNTKCGAFCCGVTLRPKTVSYSQVVSYTCYQRVTEYHRSKCRTWIFFKKRCTKSRTVNKWVL